MESNGSSPRLSEKLSISAVCLALCYILPILTGGNQSLGNALCLMHLPVLLCGFICGVPFGAAVGFIAPLLRSLTMMMPPLIVAIPMAAELCVYGIVSGLFKNRINKGIGHTYIALVVTMICGRIAGGLMNLVLLALGRIDGYSIGLFFSGYFAVALPGIILQLLVIPALLYALRRSKLIS